MTDPKDIDFSSLEKAGASLKQALQRPPNNDLERDGVIQRFEYTFELCWKYIRWYESKSWSGCHPWEIYRGGDSTHIDMSVTRPAGRKDWEVRLRAVSSTRLVEACRIALALTKAGLPFLMDDAESYISRILDQDWVGIIPREEAIAYAWQSFPQEWGVRDCVHLDWFYDESSKAKARLNKQLRLAAHWLPQEIAAFLRGHN